MIMVIMMSGFDQMEWNCFPISMIVGDDGHLWQCSSAHIGGGAGHEPLVTLLLVKKNLFFNYSLSHNRWQRDLFLLCSSELKK